jgi:hypothetical protein
MNTHILHDVHVIQQWNDQEVIIRIHVKVHAKWDHFQLFVERKSKL